MKTTSVLWHPAGKPVEVPYRTMGRTYYAKSESGQWWRLSKKSPDGWRAPVLKVKRPQWDAPLSGPKPVTAFKDEAGYTITFSDGSFEESPVQNLHQLRGTARAYGLSLVRRKGQWTFKPRKVG